MTPGIRRSGFSREPVAKAADVIVANADAISCRRLHGSRLKPLLHEKRG